MSVTVSVHLPASVPRDGLTENCFGKARGRFDEQAAREAAATLDGKESLTTHDISEYIIA